MDGIRRHLSYANVMATFAVLLAMSGGAVAATGGFSSGGTLRACANEEGVIRLLKPGKSCKKGQKAVSWNQIGPRGATGAAGAPGPTGATGAAGAAGGKGENAFTHIVIRKDVKTFAEGDDFVQCHAGEVAIGGGVTSNTPASHIWASIPFDIENNVVNAEGSVPTEWLLGISNPGTATNEMYAVCASK